MVIFAKAPCDALVTETNLLATDKDDDTGGTTAGLPETLAGAEAGQEK